MVFISTIFLFLFLPLTLSVYLILPRMLRNYWLLVTSLLFYAWGEIAYSILPNDTSGTHPPIRRGWGHRPPNRFV